jgi:hypothetical protein
MDDTSLCYNNNIIDGRCYLFLVYIFARVFFFGLKLILSGLITQFILSFKCLCQLQSFQLLIQVLAEANHKANFQTLDTKVGLFIFCVCWMGTAYLIIGHNSEAKHV